MKFLIDENEIDAIAAILQGVFSDLEFSTAKKENLLGVDDKDLIPKAAALGFNAIITRDKNQLRNRDERAAFIHSGIHWIGHGQPGARGQDAVTALSASYISAFPHIVGLMKEADSPISIYVRSIPAQRGQRVKHSVIKL